MNKCAFSDDGYIIDQRFTKSFAYGKWTSDYNGCGWIAVYNLFKVCGRDVTPEGICASMNKILPYRGSRGTPVATLESFFAKNAFPYKKITGKKNFLRALPDYNAGIIRYMEKTAPHYIAFTRISDSQYRFFNAEEGRKEHICTMQEFLDKHIWMPYIRAFLTV